MLHIYLFELWDYIDIRWSKRGCVEMRIFRSSSNKKWRFIGILVYMIPRSPAKFHPTASTQKKAPCAASAVRHPADIAPATRSRCSLPKSRWVATSALWGAQTMEYQPSGSCFPGWGSSCVLTPMEKWYPCQVYCDRDSPSDYLIIRVPLK